MLDPTEERLRFGPFELDPASGELRRDGQPIPIAPQPFRLLAALVRRPGQVLSREELRHIVWGDETFVDFERGLNFCVLQARAALGDDARKPAYIETLPRRGYRFIGTSSAPATSAAAPAPVRPRWQLAALGILLAVALIIAWQQRTTIPAGRLAVLPFENLSGPGDAHFADGMTEELVTHLGRIEPGDLRLIARASVERFRDRSRSIAAVGRELGVKHVVTGSVRREDGRVRVTAQLIDSVTETQLWSESFDRRGSGALAIQQEIAGRIAGALRLRLVKDPQRSMTAQSSAAHDAYLRGRRLWHDGKPEESVVALREAIRLEPGFVLPYIALAETIHSMAMADAIGPAEAAQEIRRAADQAMVLAPALAQTHAIRAMLAFWYDWRFDEAEENYREAIRLNPSESGALHDHGWLLIARGAFEEGIAEIRRAQELDPLSARANTHVAWAYIYSRRYREAEREVERALAIQPGFREAGACVHQVALLAGKIAPKQEIDPERPYMTATRLAMRGDRDGALEWLRRAKDARDMQFVLAGADPKLETLHADLRFVEMLGEIGLQGVAPSP